VEIGIQFLKLQCNDRILKIFLKYWVPTQSFKLLPKYLSKGLILKTGSFIIVISLTD